MINYKQLKAIFTEIEKKLLDKGSYNLRGFGTFKVKQRDYTLKGKTFKDKKTVLFKMSSTLKSKLK